MIQRHVALCASGTAVAPRAQRARHRAQGRNVLGIVPFVEFVLVLRRDIHPDQHEGGGLGWRRPVSGKQLLALVPQDALAELRSALGPGGPVLAAYREVRRAME